MMKLEAALKDLAELAPNRIQGCAGKKRGRPSLAVVWLVCEFSPLRLVGWAEAPVSVTFPVSPFWSGCVSGCLEEAT